MQALISKLHLQTRIAITLWYDISYLLQEQVETTDGCNTTTHQTTLLLPMVLHSMFEAAKQLQSTSCLIILGQWFCMQVHVHKATDLTHTCCTECRCWRSFKDLLFLACNEIAMITNVTRMVTEFIWTSLVYQNHFEWCNIWMCMCEIFIWHIW